MRPGDDDRSETAPNTAALITGASSGIGRELAHIHAGKGGNLVVVARNEAALTALKAELEAAHGVMVTVVVQDLALPGAAQALFAAVEERGITIDRLINNAGFGAYGRLAGQPAAVHAAMMQVNMVALTELTRLYLPGMIGRGGGRILNVASMAGFLSGPLQAVYYATKAYVLSFSEAVAEETRGTGVTVTALCPGPTATRFQTAAGLDGTPAFKFAASARGVAEYGYAGMERGVAIAIPGLVNRLAITALRATPRAVATRLSRLSMEKRTGIRT